MHHVRRSLLHKDRLRTGRQIELRRFLVTPPGPGDTFITIPPPDAHHIRNVLRMKRGDRIIAVSGLEEFDCVITYLGPVEVRAEIVGQRPLETQGGPSVTLAQALPKGRKMDEIIRMACEIGVTRIVPVITERSIPRPDEMTAMKKTERWRAIARSAAEQSGAPVPASVLEPSPVDKLPDVVSADLQIALWENEKRPLKKILQDAAAPGSILALAGPEGGLAEHEVDALCARGYKTVSLGGRILRTQTAGIAAVSAIFYHFSG